MTAGRERRDPGGGELDAERQVVEQATDLGDDVGVVARDPARPDRTGALGERGRSHRRRAGATGNSCSPATCSGARLVTRTRLAGDAWTTARDLARGRRAGAPCCRGRGPSTGRPGTRSARRPPAARARRTARSRARPRPGTSLGTVDGGEARRTRRRPGTRAASARAVSIARLVLPMPPGPVSVTSRASRTSVPRARRAPRRARGTTSGDRAGCRRARPAVRSGGKSDGRPGDVELAQALGARHVLEDVAAEVAQGGARRAGRRRRARRSVSDRMTWPPWPTAATRAARLTSKPP